MTFYERLNNETKKEREEFESIPFIREALKGNVTLDSYVAFLEQAYNHVKHTGTLLMASGARVPDRLAWLRQEIAEYIEEEIGHEEWILDDIRACGRDPEGVRNGKPSFATEVMVAYLYDAINRKNPLGIFGMVFVLEGTSSQVATDAARIIQGTLGLPDKAFTYLTSHGSLDKEHIKMFEGIVNRLESEEDKECIIHCARAVYRLYGDIFRTLPLQTLNSVKEAA